MEPIATLALIVAILVPAVHLNPLPQGNCTATDEDLSSIRSAIQKATAGKELQDDTLPAEILERCPMLKNITDKIKFAANEILQLKESSITTDQVDELKASFEQKVNDITKSKDIFEKEFSQKDKKKHGKMIELMTALQVEVTNLEKEIVEKTQRMYEDMAELIFQQLQMNNTDRIRSYTKQIIDQKLDELIRKLETDHRTFLGALRFLNQMNDSNLIDKVFDGILKRLDGIDVTVEKDLENAKYVLVNLLCWTVNNDLLTKKFVAKRPELYKIALKIYPNNNGKNKEAHEADIRSRQFCDANFPVNVITWFAVTFRS